MKYSFFVLLMIALPFHVTAEWSGASIIKNYWVYPNYAVVQHGGVSGGRADCNQNDRWSFRWSSFDSDTANRIHSTLLAAKLSEKKVNVVLSDSQCGPEGQKQFEGKIQLVP